MSYVSEGRLEWAADTLLAINKVLLPVCVLVYLVAFTTITLLITWMGPTNMSAELVRATTLGNTLGVAALAFCFGVDRWIMERIE